MVYQDYVRAQDAAISIMDAHAMVVIKIIFEDCSEAEDFYSYMQPHAREICMEQNGFVMGFIIDKITARSYSIIRDIFQTSAGYVVHSWHVA